MDREELFSRLLAFDRDAFLTYGSSKIKYECYIVGGGAMLIMGLIPRATHDIDVLRCTAYELISLMPKYDMNMNVTAHIGCFADDYSSRAEKIDLDTKLIDFYTLSLEDLVVSKLASGREQDFEDIHQPAVVQKIDWDKLDELIDLAIEGMVGDYSARELRDFYNDYKEEFKK